MDTTTIDNLVNNYYKWLKDKAAFKQFNDYYEITTPYLDFHNDYIQIYLKKIDGNYRLTDDGYTLTDLKQSGVDITTSVCAKILNLTINGFGVKKNIETDEIFVDTNEDNFSLNKHNLIQAILSISDMFYLARQSTLSLFFEDVKDWLDNNEIRFSPNIQFTGKSGYPTHFDFVIPKSRNAPERIIKTINNPNKQQVTNILFAWEDTKNEREENTVAYTVLNDLEKQIGNNITSSLDNYGIKPILWSKKDDFIPELVA